MVRFVVEIVCYYIELKIDKHTIKFNYNKDNGDSLPKIVNEMIEEKLIPQDLKDKTLEYLTLELKIYYYNPFSSFHCLPISSNESHTLITSSL